MSGGSAKDHHQVGHLRCFALVRLVELICDHQVELVSLLPTGQPWVRLCTLRGKFECHTHPTLSTSPKTLSQVVISLLPLALSPLASAIYNASLCEGAFNSSHMLFRSSIADGILTSDQILVAGCLIGSWALAAASPLLLQLPIFLTLLKHYPAGQPRPKE